MKINSELRKAVLAVVQESNRKAKLVEAENKAALASFTSKSKRIQRVLQRIKTTEAAAKAARQALKDLGISQNYDGLYPADYAKLEKAGLKLKPTGEINEFIVFSRLARSTPAEGPTYLSELGINWE